jgi:hypothetical protein
MSARHVAALGGCGFGVSAETLVTKPLLNVTAAAVTILAGVAAWLCSELALMLRRVRFTCVLRWPAAG